MIGPNTDTNLPIGSESAMRTKVDEDLGFAVVEVEFAAILTVCDCDDHTLYG